jgi:hypothetical protein
MYPGEVGVAGEVGEALERQENGEEEDGGAPGRSGSRGRWRRLRCSSGSRRGSWRKRKVPRSRSRAQLVTAVLLRVALLELWRCCHGVAAEEAGRGGGGKRRRGELGLGFGGGAAQLIKEAGRVAVSCGGRRCR